ncbi:MAG TPA: NAD(P)H-binding protein [Chthoniobacterales bacterium]|nr:NAD(P)H-binding protein [Chthoniobacterales bacterium]
MQPCLPMILVTGASGSTGSEVVKRLSARRVPVRAMVRRPPVQAHEASSSVEYITADFEDPVSLRRALDGIERAFLVTNSSERTEAQQLGFVDVARTAGLRHIVYLSQLNATKNSPVRFLRYHARARRRPRNRLSGLLSVPAVAGRQWLKRGRHWPVRTLQNEDEDDDEHEYDFFRIKEVLFAKSPRTTACGAPRQPQYETSSQQQ